MGNCVSVMIAFFLQFFYLAQFFLWDQTSTGWIFHFDEQFTGKSVRHIPRRYNNNNNKRRNNRQTKCERANARFYFIFNLFISFSREIQSHFANLLVHFSLWFPLIYAHTHRHYWLRFPPTVRSNHLIFSAFHKLTYTHVYMSENTYSRKNTDTDTDTHAQYTHELFIFDWHIQSKCHGYICEWAKIVFFDLFGHFFIAYNVTDESSLSV